MSSDDDIIEVMARAACEANCQSGGGCYCSDGECQDWPAFKALSETQRRFLRDAGYTITKAIPRAGKAR